MPTTMKDYYVVLTKYTPSGNIYSTKVIDSGNFDRCCERAQHRLDEIRSAAYLLEIMQSDTGLAQSPMKQDQRTCLISWKDVEYKLEVVAVGTLK